MTENKTITVPHNQGHGNRVGDIITVSERSRRWSDVAQFIWRPRKSVVTDVTHTTFTFEEQKVSWREFFINIWILIWK